jgi:hypothetical protein
MRLSTYVFLITTALLSGPSAHATCDHPYWVFSKGVTRHYKSSNGDEQNWKVEKVEGDNATVTITWTYDKNKAAKESQMEVECNDQGISLDFTKLAESPEGMQVKVVKHRGVFLPPPSKLKAGYTWDATATIEMTSPGTTKPMTAEITASHKVEGTESVTVPAGVFEALTITAKNEMTMLIPEMNGNDGSSRAAAMPGMTTHTTSTYWLVKGVGIVKVESKAEMGGRVTGAGGGTPGMSNTTTTELTGYSK